MRPVGSTADFVVFYEMMQHSDSPAVPADVWNWFGVLPSVDKNPSFACADDIDDTILEHEADVLSDFRMSSNFLLRRFTSDSISWTSVIPIGSDIFVVWFVDDDNKRHLRSKEVIDLFPFCLPAWYNLQKQ